MRAFYNAALHSSFGICRGFMPDASPSTARADHAALDRFVSELEQALAARSFVKLVLSKHRGTEPDLQRLTVREVTLREQPHLSFLFTHTTRDITKNLPLPEALAFLRDQLGAQFGQAHLLTTDEDLQLLSSKKGKHSLLRQAARRDEAPAGHDREKHRFVELDRPFLAALGVTSAQGQLIPAMSRKWKQINKFVEVFSHALEASPLATAKRVNVVDFGSGKGYLTFAVHDHLKAKGVDARVTGVELRPDMVALCNAAATKLALGGLRFEQGDVRHYTPEALNVMIALHACDTATDHAIHLGVRAGADIILCSPCCHKQIRPQLLSPHPLRPILQHGVHLGQEAEMLTDGLRAMLLEWCGYETQVFEFISLEHTNKNKMILAVKRAAGINDAARQALMSQIQDIKGFYGIRDHCLESLLLAATKPF